MNTIRRLLPYFRPRWRIIAAGIGFMALYALFSGFSIALILPIMEKVFMREGKEAAAPIHVTEGLRDTGTAMAGAWNAGGSLSDRLDHVRESLVAGLTRIQNQAPPLEVLTWFCLIILVAVFFKNLSDYGRKFAFIRVEQSTTEALRRDLFRRVLSFPLTTFNRISSGQFLSRIVTDVELVKQLTVNNAASFIHNLFQVIVYLAITIWASVQLSLGAFLIVPPIILMTGKIASKLRRQSRRAQSRIADLTAALNETLGGIRIVKAFGMEPRENERFARATSRYRRAVVRLMSLDTLAAPLSEFWGVLIGVGVLYFGGRLVLEPDSSLNVGRFFLFLFALVSMLHPLKELTNVVTRFQRGAAAAARVFEVLDMSGERDADDAVPLPPVSRDIVFESVSFLYEPRRPVLREVSFRAPAGTTTALVGPSGAGKSTLVDLIPRFYDPDSGRILADGIDLRRVRRADLRRQIGIVTQEPILFDDTVAANIGYGKEGAGHAAIVEAARAANAHEFIEAMTEGYDTVIGERGIRLSGGQRQRLAIARAVLRNPDILILDEATSSLDSESETLVQEALDRLLVGRTTFIIAHRLSTVMQADRILVLDAGRIVETGTHRELLDRQGLYHRLYTLQFRSQEAPRLDAVES
jgi:subfamily B ATP-binding cassette protein MsbA